MLAEPAAPEQELSSQAERDPRRAPPKRPRASRASAYKRRATGAAARDSLTGGGAAVYADGAGPRTLDAGAESGLARLNAGRRAWRPA